MAGRMALISAEVLRAAPPLAKAALSSQQLSRVKRAIKHANSFSARRRRGIRRRESWRPSCSAGLLGTSARLKPRPS
jgi:hypothetical protein